VLAEEAELLNKAFLCLELPRLAEARLHAACEIGGMLLSVRSSHGALLTQAAEAFFAAATSAVARYPSHPLPPHLRVVMEPPRLLHGASTLLADAGQPDAALMAATSATWRPTSGGLPALVDTASIAAGPPGHDEAATEAKLARRRSKNSKKNRERAASPSFDAPGAPPIAPPPPAPPPPPPPGPVPLDDFGTPAVPESPPARSALLDEIRQLRID
jgi:hypothetical protein